MKHRSSTIKLSRKSSHVSALMSNLCACLIIHESIKTTLPKAKALSPYFEKLLSACRAETTFSRRLLSATLRNESACSKLFLDISRRNANRHGGNVRIVKCGLRSGDKAKMAIIQLVDRS